MWKAVATLLLSASFACSQPAADETFRLKNGRFWASLPSETQPMYLAGIVEGWELRADTEELVQGKVINALRRGGSVTYSELARMVSTAYSSAENLSLPIGWVLMADLAIQRGETTIEAVFPALRRHLSSISARKGGVESPGISPIDAILEVQIKRPN
jgi:hypothetical protein